MVKKGFTLIELLAVIMILGLIGLIAVPKVAKVLKSSKERLYNSQVEMIEVSAKRWGFDNSNDLSETKTVYLSLKDLINDGYIEQNELKDPRDTKKVMNGCILIKYDDSYTKYKYEYDDKECGELDIEKNMTSADPQYMCYDFDESNGTIVKYDINNTDCFTDVDMPNRIDGVTVKHIGNAAFINHNGQSCVCNNEDEVSVPDGYVRNEEDGYIGCYFHIDEPNIYITSITFPKYLETIGTASFAEHSITSLDFSNLTNLVRINDTAFHSNPIESVNFTNVPNLTYIGSATFGYNNLITVTIPDSVTTIGDFAFADNELISVTIPTNVTTIGYATFAANELISVTIPDSVTTIGESAFDSNQLSSITIPNSVTTIGEYAFYNNKILQGNAIIDNNIVNVRIEDDAFSNNGADGNTPITPVFSR